MVDFNFFLNRQGVRGNKGEQGEQGYSPRITVKTETAAEYVLNVQNEDGSFDTPNLRGNAIENLGGTYVRFNQDTEQMYTGYADTASTTSQGEVVLSTYEDLASGGDESEVTTSKDVHDFVEAKISEASVNYVDIDDYTQKMGELDSEISDLDENKLDFTGLTNTLAAGTNITITPNVQTGKITIAGEPVSQAQADWNQTDINAPDYIKNKPVIDDELSSTSTNAVQNRLVTNAINLISNEFENYATNKLDNLLNDGEARLHALKAYSDNGELLTDTEGLNDVIKYAHSTFDLSKFTVVGSPVITDDGIASRFSSNNYLITPITMAQLKDKSWEVSTKWVNEGVIASSNSDGDPLVILGTADYVSLRSGISINELTSSKGIYFFCNCGNPDEETTTGQAMRANKSYTQSGMPDWAIATMKFDINSGTYYFYVEDSFNPTKTLIGTYVPSTVSKQLASVYNDSSSYISCGRGAARYIKNAIDLKQFSITVGGVEVFSGNKTDIDTIKPDDYTVVGTPTITDDGVLTQYRHTQALDTGINLSNYNSWKIEFPFIFDARNNDWTTLLNTLGRDSILLYNVSSENGFRWSLKDNDGNSIVASGEKRITSTTGDNMFLEAEFTGSQYNVIIKNLTKNTQVSTSTDSTTKIKGGNLLIGYGTSNSSNTCYHRIDLNAFKIYVDGNLVYQPCLKIPYTQSKTGSKIVNAIYRDRVNDMASQLGSANYYTLDEDNGNFTLPQVELYGLIEKAASTVPSGVVQSSTIRNIVSLTQAEYDALTTKDSDIFYIITSST